MMTTKVVRPPLGRRERGWQGETELLPLPFFLSLPLCRASKREKEGRRERGAGWILPSTGSVRLLQPGSLNWLLSLRKRKKKRKRKNSPSLLPYSPSLVFFLTREISERAIYIKSRKLSLHSFSLSLSLTRLGVNLLRNSRRIPRRALGVFAVSRAASQQGDKFARCFFLYFPFLFSLLSLVVRTDRFCRGRDSHRRPIISGRATANRKIILAESPQKFL